MFGYKIHIEHYMTNSYHSNEQYGEWSENFSNTFESIEPTTQYPDVLSFEEIKTGEECFVVWAEWSSGDSFGSSTDGVTEAIMVFKSQADAQDLRDQLLNGSEDYTQNVTLKSGLEMIIRKGWVGYFESLSDIHVTAAIMGVSQ